ncbi:MAG: hypothetical protein ACK559_28200 [bacterium]
MVRFRRPAADGGGAAAPAAAAVHPLAAVARRLESASARLHAPAQRRRTCFSSPTERFRPRGADLGATGAGAGTPPPWSAAGRDLRCDRYLDGGARPAEPGLPAPATAGGGPAALQRRCLP